MRSRPAGHGFTLVELLIGLTLLSLLTLMFAWFIVPALRMASLGTTRVDIQQMAVLACNKVAADLQGSARLAVSLHSRAAADPGNDPVVVAMVPIKDVDQNGRRIWKQEVVTYFWDRNTRLLLRRTFPPGPPASLSVDPLPVVGPTRFSTADLLALANPAAPVIRVASRVVNFDATKLSEPADAYVVDISIEENVSGKRQAERFDYKKVVSLRN